MPADSSKHFRLPAGLAVLVVEDEVLLRVELSEELRSAGYAVVEAATGDAAKALLESPNRIALVCTDVRMPGKLNGIALTRWIKANHPDLPVIIISGEVTARHVPDLADAQLTKPVKIAQLISRIEGLLALRK